MSLDRINIFSYAFISLNPDYFFMNLRYYFDLDKNILNMRRKQLILFMYLKHIHQVPKISFHQSFEEAFNK